MTDNDKPDSQVPGAAAEPSVAGAELDAAADPSTLPQLLVRGQYTKDLSFENPGAPQSLVETGTAPDIQVNVNVNAERVEEDAFEVILSISGEAKSGEKTLFLVELAYAGLFSVSNVPDDQLQPLLLIECPRILFPFARNIVADATREGGFPPLFLQPIDFTQLYLQHVGQQQQPVENA